MSNSNPKDVKEQQTAPTKRANNYERKKPRTPKKITPSYLHNSGLYYLERFSSSVGNFRAVMRRKIKKSCDFHKDQDFNACTKMLEDTIEKFIKLELLNDQTYTRSFVNSLRRRGKSSRAIKAYLAQKYIASDLIEQTLSEHTQTNFENETEAEFETAMTFARKKRLGPFRGHKEPELDKELGKLARAGFNYDTAKRVLENED